LSRIESKAFSETGLVKIIVPASVQVFGEKCFSGFRSLSSVTFEWGSKLLGIQREILGKAVWVGMAKWTTQLPQWFGWKLWDGDGIRQWISAIQGNKDWFDVSRQGDRWEKSFPLATCIFDMTYPKPSRDFIWQIQPTYIFQSE
jgi:hypothetical protein